MKKSSLLWLSVLSVIFLAYPILAQYKDNSSSYLIEQSAKKSSFSQKYGPERYGSEGYMGEEFTQHYPKGKYGPAGYGTENERY